MFSSCDHSLTQETATYIPSDTSTSFKINNYWVTPKISFDFNSLGISSGDTLNLVTCSEYVYAPFGLLTDKGQFKNSLLKDFTSNDTLLGLQGEWQIEAQTLKLNSNKLLLFFDNDSESSKHSYILDGEIVDDKVQFSDKIKVGMSIEDFYKTFFDYFPTVLHRKYKIVELESCVTDVIHIYAFNNGQLSSVKFIGER